MIPDKKLIESLLKKYSPNEKYYELIKTHGEIVAEIALHSAAKTSVDVNIEILRAACLLHDIGSYVFVGADKHMKDFGRCYPGHALYGAAVLRG